MTSPGTARLLWSLAEPFHALTYFAAEAQAAFDAVGLTGFWSGYFAGRAAPLGAVGAEVVGAAFVGFEPGFVARRVPAVWSAASPAAALDARLAGVDAAVRRVLGDDWPRSEAAAEAVRLAAVAAAAVDVAGRPLAAANAALAAPGEPHLALWQALTTLREHRGDGHTAALVVREVDGVQSHVLAAAAGRSDRAWLQKARGWDDAAWDAAAAHLADRGWLHEGALTAEGLAMVTAIEADTDRLALGPWRALGARGCDRLVELLGPVRRAVLVAGLWPAGNPIGVPDPD
ncbi:SCO6745 family protein [Blastococcus sp. SYSU D01042]